MPASFCEFSVCKEYQHCCGDNVCCNNNEINLLDLLFVTLVTIVIGMLCLGILYKYRESILTFCRRMYRRMCRKCIATDYSDMGSEIGMASSNQTA